MSSDRDREGHPLMEKPQPSAPENPESPPPMYSSIFGAQSQTYAPIPQTLTQPPYPMQTTSLQPPYPGQMSMPMPQVTSAYPIENGKAMPSSVYSPTTYDPTVNVPVNETIPNRTIIVPRDSGIRQRRRRCMQILSVIGVIVIVIGVGVWAYKKAQRKKNEQWLKAEKEMRERLREMNPFRDFNDYDAIQREFVHPIQQSNPGWYRQQYNDRFRRTVRDEQSDSSDHRFFDINYVRPDFGESLDPEKSQRQRRSVGNKNSFRKKYKGTSNKKGIYHRR